MANPAYELARLTTKSVTIDGTGFGGERPDNLTVAGALAFMHPKTKKKLSKQADNLGRYKYCFDDSCKRAVVENLAATFSKSNLKPDTLLNMSSAAVINYKHVLLKFNKTSLAHDRYELKNAQLAALIGIERQSFTQTHRDLYNAMYDHLVSLDCEVCEHLNATMKDE